MKAAQKDSKHIESHAIARIDLISMIPFRSKWNITVNIFNVFKKI